MSACAVKSCKNYIRKVKKDQGITYHRFPRNAYQKDAWVNIIRNTSGNHNWNSSSTSVVCSDHFEDADFKITAKGLRTLVPGAIPTKLLFNPPEIQTQNMCSPILLISSNDGEAENQQPSSSSGAIPSPMLQLPEPPEKFGLTGHCRLCASPDCNGNLINLKNDNKVKELVVEMTDRLQTKIDLSQEHLPATICSACLKNLYTAYDFVVGIDLAQTTLNNLAIQKHEYQMSENREHSNYLLPSTSLQQVPINDKVAYSLEQSSPQVPNSTNSLNQISPQIGIEENNLEQPISFVSDITAPAISESNIPFLLETPRERRLKYKLNKNRQLIDSQKKKIKILNQKVRRLQNRNESLKNLIKNLKERDCIDTDLFNRLSENIVAVNLFDNINRKKLN